MKNKKTKIEKEEEKERKKVDEEKVGSFPAS